MIRTILQVTILGFTFNATIFLIKGGLSLSVEAIAELSSTKCGYNSKIIKNLCDERVNTWCGFLFLLSSFILQMINLLWQMRWDDFDVNTLGVFISIAITFITYITAHFVAKTTRDKTRERVENIFLHKRGKQ